MTRLTTDDPPDFDLLFTPRSVCHTLGEAVRDRRRAMGITQKDLARRSGTTFRDVSDLENDRTATITANEWKIIRKLNEILTRSGWETITVSEYPR